MSQATPTLIASSARPVGLRVRPDLRYARQQFQGRICWAVKDPLRLAYYRFEDEECQLLRMFDGRASIEEIRHRFETRFAPQRITQREIQQFATRAYQSRLLVSDASGQGDLLLDRRRERRQQKWWATLANPLAVRIPLLDPDRLLAWFNRGAGWLFTWPAALCGLALALGALTLLLVHFDQLQSRLPAFQQFFGSGNWIWLAATLILTKILHELGHGVACKRFGGECHELGVMLLVLTPCLYCNVTDAWMLPDKWRRIVIGAGGMYVELWLATLATFVWWHTHPGTLHYLCLNVMFVCGVSTLAFNANPLLRFDGYYILADWLEVPNLRRQSSVLVQRQFKRTALGIQTPPDPFLPRRYQGIFASYAIAAFLYRGFVAISILWFLEHVFEPYGFQVVGRLLMMAVVAGMFAGPVRAVVRMVRTPGMTRQIKPKSAVRSVVVVGAVLAGMLLVPLPYRVVCPVRIEPRGGTAVYVDVPGHVTAVHVRPGEPVQAGQPLLTLDNVELRTVVRGLKNDRAELTGRLAGLRSQAFHDPSALAEMESLGRAVETLDAQLERRRGDLERLTIVAPRSGVVLATGRRPPASAEGRLGQWTDHPLERRNLGATLAAGVIVCQIAPPALFQAILMIDQGDLPMVTEGQRVDLFLKQSPTRRWTSHIQHVARERQPAAAHSLESLGQDSLSPVSDRTERRLASTSYEASCELDDDSGLLVAGGSGEAKIHAARQTIARRIWRYVMKTIRF